MPSFYQDPDDPYANPSAPKQKTAPTAFGQQPSSQDGFYDQGPQTPYPTQNPTYDPNDPYATPPAGWTPQSSGYVNGFGAGGGMSQPVSSTPTTVGINPPPPPQTPDASGLFSGPGAYEQWLKQHQGAFDAPSAVEDVYGSGLKADPNGSRSSSLGDASSGKYGAYVDSHVGAYDKPGASEDLYNSVGRNITGNNYAAGAMQDIGVPTIDAGRTVFAAGERDLSDPGSLEQRYDEMGNAFNDPGRTEDVYGKYGTDPFTTESFTERLYNSGIERLNPYYDYAQDRAIEQAQRSTAARGGFNSGLAAQSERDITTKLRGEQAMAQERLAPIADSERRARYDQGFDYAGRTDQEYRDRINAAFGLSKMDQDAEENRFKTRGDLARISDQGTEAEGRLGIDAARAESEAAGRADESDVNRARAAADIAANSDTSQRNRLNDAMDAVYRGDELDLRRDTENRLRAGQADDEERQRINDIYTHAGDTDTSRRDRIEGSAGMARDLQATGQARIQQMIDNMAGQDTREAKLLTDIYNDMSSVDEIDEQWIQATAQKYGIDLQQMHDIADFFGTLLGTGGKIGAAAVA